MDQTNGTTAETTTTSSMEDYYNMIKAEHEANNAWSAEQAQKAMDYQTEMSNTAHQREVADLKAAGLNPVLSAGGQGATTGSGAQAQRSDENVNALYGLTKMALEASIEQSKSMNNVAKYTSGASGYSNSGSSSSEIGDAVLDAAADFIYRRFGIKQDHTKALLQSLGFDNLDDALAYAKNALGFKTESVFNSTNMDYKADDKKKSSLKNGKSSVGSKVSQVKSYPYRASQNTAKSLVKASNKAASKIKSVSRKK